MSEKFGMLLTDAGRLKLLRVPLGGTLGISHVVVGDGSGAAILPAPHMEALVHEVYRTAPAAVDVVDGGEIASGKVWLQVEAVIPVEAGGFWVRELGLLSADGTLVAVGNYPDSYKPTLDSGIGKDMYLKAIIELASADAEKVELVVDPSVVLATREFVGREVDRALAEMTEHIGDKGNPHAVTAAQVGAMSRLEVNSAIARAVPAGVCVPFGGEKAPAGWFPCNGAAVSRTAYAQLFGAIGTVYGAGDGSSTFNLPDMRGEFLRGLDDGRGIDAERAAGSYQPGTKVCGELSPDPDFNGHTVHNIANVQGDPVYESGSQFDPRVEFVQNSGMLNVQSNPRWWRTTRPRNIAMPFIIKF